MWKVIPFIFFVFTHKLFDVSFNWHLRILLNSVNHLAFQQPSFENLHSNDFYLCTREPWSLLCTTVIDQYKQTNKHWSICTLIRNFYGSWVVTVYHKMPSTAVKIVAAVVAAILTIIIIVVIIVVATSGDDKGNFQSCTLPIFTARV